MERCQWKEINIIHSTGEHTLKFISCDGFEPVYDTINGVVICKSCKTDIYKPEPKQPTHEELQKRIFDTLAYLNCGVVHQYETIIKLLTGRKSADIPPEA